MRYAMQQILENLYLRPSSSPSQVSPEPYDGHRRGHAVRLSVSGELDLATVDSLSHAAIGALRLPVRILVLDIHGVTFCGAAGISTLIKIRQAAAETGTRLVLTGIQPPVASVFDLVGFSAMLPPPAGDAGSAAETEVGAALAALSLASAGAVQPDHSRPLQAA
jgi:anti-sigma B factor antagonist